MLDLVRNSLIILTTGGAIMVAVFKFFYNMPLNIFKLTHRFEFKESSSFESILSTFVFFVYSVFFLIIIAGFFYNNPINANITRNPYEKLNNIIYISFLILFALSLVLIFTSMDSKLVKGKTKFKFVIYIVSIVFGFVAIIGLLINITSRDGIYSNRVRLAVNEVNLSIQTNDSLKEININNIEIRKNGKEIIEDVNQDGRLILSYQGNVLSYNINSNIAIKEHDKIEMFLDSTKVGEIGDFNIVKEIISYFNEISFALLYFGAMILAVGILKTNNKINEKTRYLLVYSDNKQLEVKVYYDFNDFYLVRSENRNMYISKKEIKSVIEIKDETKVNTVSLKTIKWIFENNLLRISVYINILVVILTKFLKFSISVVVFSIILTLIINIKSDIFSLKKQIKQMNKIDHESKK